MAKKEKELNYTSAFQELTEIQFALESNQIPIDELSDKVKRANELIQFCRTKLRETEDEVQNILDQQKN